MVNNKLLHEVVMNFIPTKKGIVSKQIEAKFKGPKPELGKSIHGGSKIKDSNTEKTESIKITNLVKATETVIPLGGSSKLEKQKTESMKKTSTVKPAETVIPLGGSSKLEKQKTESMKKTNLIKPAETVIPLGGTVRIEKQKTESMKKTNIIKSDQKAGKNSKSKIDNQNSNTVSSNNISEKNKSIKNSNTTSINNHTITDYKPSIYKFQGGKSQKKEEFSKVKEYILKNGGQITKNVQADIPKNSYREIVIPMSNKSKSKSSKNGGKKKTSRSKKRSSKKKSNIKIKSSAPNNLKNDIDNLIRSSKKMSFHRVYKIN
jgi:hypothetical protein